MSHKGYELLKKDLLIRGSRARLQLDLLILGAEDFSTQDLCEILLCAHSVLDAWKVIAVSLDSFIEAVLILDKLGYLVNSELRHLECMRR